MHKIKFHLTKYLTLMYVYILSMIRPWKKVEGIYLPINLSIGYNTLRWILNGLYEKGEIDIIKNKLNKEDIVFEIGTGLGFVSTYCAKILGDSNVFTFEANRTNIPVCKSVFKKNGVNPILQNAFLSDTTGNVNFPVNKNNRLGSSVLLNTNDVVSIPKLNLNIEINKVQPSFLIMDIEGGEVDIFSIIQFQTIKKIQFELHPDIIGKEKCDTIFSLLKNNGFEMDTQLSQGQNYFFEKLDN